MSDSPDSLRFRFDPADLRPADLIEAARSFMLGLKPLEVLRAGASPGFWIGAAKSTIDLMKHLVDVPLADVLVGAWKTHQRFAKYTDRNQFPPDRISVVPLWTHRIKSTHEPYIELFVDGQAAGRIPFELELEVTVEGGALVIQDARFKRIEAGRARMSGTLKCAGQVISQRTSRDFAWTEAISFGEGVPIGAVA
ncbi:MAG TPA: hypothetical protein VFU46_09230 [Gemmatimonadales bacterium]|nr:hypothetical protein [Gemmatimonadales bacterium]